MSARLCVTPNGWLAINSANSGSGRQLALTSYKLALATPYDPFTLQNSQMQGVVKDISSNIAYRVVTPKICEIDTTVTVSQGTYQFNELGIFTDAGALFAVAVYPTIYTKTTGLAEISLRNQLAFDNLESILQFQIRNFDLLVLDGGNIGDTYTGNVIIADGGTF